MIRLQGLFNERGAMGYLLYKTCSEVGISPVFVLCSFMIQMKEFFTFPLKDRSIWNVWTSEEEIEVSVLSSTAGGALDIQCAITLIEFFLGHLTFVSSILSHEMLSLNLFLKDPFVKECR